MCLWIEGGRWRRTLAKLVMLAGVLAAAAGALSVLLWWYYQPSFATRNPAQSLTEASRLTATLFDLRGIAFAAWTLTALAIGSLAGMLVRRVVPAIAATLAGMLVRRVVPAIAATLAGYAGLAVIAGLYLRPHYLTPLITGVQNVPGSAWVTSQWGTRGGRFVFADQPPLSLLERICVPPPRGAHVDKTLTVAQCLTKHGYTWWASYQPAGRFWPFQWIEGGWLLALSVPLLAGTVWLVRRRAA